MKALASIAVVLAVLALIVELSVAGARREESRLLEEFTTATRRQAHASAEVLSARLDALDQDTRVLTDLVERSRHSPEHEPRIERRVSETAFRALVVVVPHYRIISLNRANGEVEILAVDPTETTPTVDALTAPMQHLAREVSTRRVKAIGEHARFGSRSFLLYGTPVRGGGAVVVASDAAMFLAAGSWPSLPVARLFVTDPAGVVWTGCATERGCSATDSATVTKYFQVPAPSAAQIPPEAADVLGVGRAAAVQVSEAVERPTGNWIVTWVASSRAIMDRQAWLLSRVVISAIGAAFAVAGVGFFIMRQQRRALALEGELRYARAVAAARDLENQLVRAEKLITVGVLSTEMAHEIGSPLAVIRGRAEQILREVSSGPRAEDLAIIIKHVDNISSTVRQILDFARRPATERRAASLQQAIERARELLAWKLDARHIGLDVSVQDGLPQLTADADQLQQVLVNLLLNACDASQADGHIRLEAFVAESGMVRIRVIDQGSGIAPEHLQAVFDPFFTTKPRGEGTGLGLPIAASIVRNHGGRIDLSSTPGAGTTATVMWPAADLQEVHG
ncbi:MAG TPA: ATP-binding protein [Polyangia bacterium]|nr:ATP-binding protein [Polyangia bacterium]